MRSFGVGVVLLDYPLRRDATQYVKQEAAGVSAGGLIPANSLIGRGATGAWSALPAARQCTAVHYLQLPQCHAGATSARLEP